MSVVHHITYALKELKDWIASLINAKIDFQIGFTGAFYLDK